MEFQNQTNERDIARTLADLPEVERRRVLSALSPEELEALEWAWPVWARPEQLPPPGPWRTWLQLAGRGSGKSRASAECVRAEVEAGRRRCIGLVSPTADTARRDVADTLLRISPPWNRCQHEPSQRRVTWENGAVGWLLSSEEPDRIRGLNLDYAWVDELTSLSNAGDVWSNLQLALRVAGPKGDEPAVIVSTTPKRHVLLKAIMAAPSTVVTRSKTWDNAANLSASTLEYLRATYEGTTLGRQELLGELIEDLEGALWNRAMLDTCRVQFDEKREYRRVVVAIDPAGGASKTSDETGIVVCGKGMNDHGYVLQDLSGRYSPQTWAKKAIGAFYTHKADRIAVESNYGGEMVVQTIRSVDQRVPVKIVHASRGKQVRAEPIVSFYEQHRVHHVGTLTELEDQLCGWDPNQSSISPDRLDALVWGLTELMVAHGGGMRVQRLAY
jgi:phage terminase large subunit-like protein